MKWKNLNLRKAKLVLAFGLLGVGCSTTNSTLKESNETIIAASMKQSAEYLNSCPKKFEVSGEKIVQAIPPNFLETDCLCTYFLKEQESQIYIVNYGTGKTYFNLAGTVFDLKPISEKTTGSIKIQEFDCGDIKIQLKQGRVEANRAWENAPFNVGYQLNKGSFNSSLKLIGRCNCVEGP